MDSTRNDDAALKAFYDDSYGSAAETDQHAQWRDLCARNKAEHLVELCGEAGLAPQSVLEVGCGDGALLARLDAGDFASQLFGIELAEPAAKSARSRGLQSLVSVELFDGSAIPAADQQYDLAVLSHVLEHVPDPPTLLREAARVAQAVFVEVPLEDNVSGRRPNNVEVSKAIGHLHQLKRADVESWCSEAGVTPIASLSDPLPREVRSFFAQGAKGQLKATATTAVRSTVHAASADLAQRLFTVHYAVLAVPTTT